MNAKINLRQLAERLPAETFGRDIDERVSIVSEIFGVTADMLADGEDVTLPGIGTFALTGDPSDPVEFKPDRSYADSVNAPFASFSPVELAPEVTETMLDSVDEADRDSETAETEAEVITPEPAMPEPIVEPEPEPEPIVAPQPVEEPAAVVEPEAAVETPAEYQPTIEEYDEAYTESDDEAGSRFGVGFFCGLLTGLVVGALLFLVYVMYTTGVMSPESTESYVVEMTE